ANIALIFASTSHAPSRSAASNAPAYAAAARVLSGSCSIAVERCVMDSRARRAGAIADSTASQTMSEGVKSGTWRRSPTSGARTRPGAAATNEPADGYKPPAMMRSKVDLPAPFSPMRPTRSPAGTVNETSVRTRRSPKANDTPSSQRWEASGAAWELREDMSVPGRRKTCRAPAAAAGRAHSVLHSVNVADSEDPERAIMPARAFAADGPTRRAWYPSGSHNRR